MQQLKVTEKQQPASFFSCFRMLRKYSWEKNGDGARATTAAIPSDDVDELHI